MPDMEKVIRHIKAEIEIAKLCKKDFASVDIDMLSDAYELLKEQEDIGKELETAIELIHKKNKRIEKLNAVLKEQPQIVRCKDCKHRNTIYCFKDEQGFGTDDDWFCADGEVKDDGNS